MNDSRELLRVQTNYGPIQGEIRDGIAVFRGIPYGGNCDAEGRFLPPIPPAPWSDVRDCTKNGPVATQGGPGSIGAAGPLGRYFSGGKPEMFGYEYETKSENCLVLNVVTPGTDDRKRPVMVYNHGGGYGSGSGSLVLGSDLWAKEEDIVIVGVNHRLNVFGYLYLGAFDEKYVSSGMAGMLDLVLALEWVRDNIEAFGGDPAKVSIMGESGGGGKVNHLLAMPEARGLFRSCIIESGSGAPGTLSAEQATESAKALLDVLGIPHDQWQKLLEIPAEELCMASYRINGGMGFAPCADGIHLQYNPGRRYMETDPALPMLVGASEDEMSCWMEPTPGGLSWEGLREKLLQPPTRRGPGDGASPIHEGNVDQVIKGARAIDTKGVDPEHIYYAIQSMSGSLGGGAFQQAMAKAELHSGPVYNYFVTFDAPHPMHEGLRFSWHTADLPLQMRVVEHACCEYVSKTMAHAWAAFIRTGDPSTPELAWPAFTAETRQVMVIDEPCRIETDPTAAYRTLL